MNTERNATVKRAVESSPGIQRFLAQTDDAMMTNGEVIVALTIVLAGALAQGDKVTLTESIGFILAHVKDDREIAMATIARLCTHCGIVI